MIIDVFRGLAPCPDDAAMDAGDANDVDTNADAFAVGLNILPDAKSKGKRMLPDGLDRRSSCHMHMLREAKRVKGMDDAQVQMREDLAKLGSAWNDTVGLRRGDMVLDDTDDLKGLQSSQWTMTGLLRVGWQEVGHRSKRSQDSNGVGATHR